MTNEMSEQTSDKRLAFLLGNSAYGKYGDLANAERDVDLIAKKLQILEFEVDVHVNLQPGQIADAFNRFIAKLDEYGGVDTAAIYYAGHGFQEDGQNYILSVPDAHGEVEEVPVSFLIGKLRQGRRGQRSARRLLFFDACRDYLDTDATATSLSKTRSAERAGIRPEISVGLSDAQIDYGTDTMLSFSAAPGKPALDAVEESKFSPYAQALADHMDSVGLSLDFVLKRVNADVTEWTNGAQTPWTVEALKKPFYFSPSPLLFLTGNIIALVAVAVGIAMMLTTFMQAGAEMATPYAASAILPIMSLTAVLGAFTALLYGFLRAYSRALGARMDEANVGTELTPPFHGALGGFLGGIIGAPLIAVPYWWVWRQSVPGCQTFEWIDPYAAHNCQRLGYLLAEITLATVLITAVLGYLAVFFSNRIRQNPPGWAIKLSDTQRLLVGAMIGGTLTSIVVVPPLTAFFGSLNRPFLEPNFVMVFAVSCASILAFSTVNYSLERFSPARLKRSLAASIIAPILSAIPLAIVLLIMLQTGFIDMTLFWAQVGFFDSGLSVVQRYSFLFVAGLIYGLTFGAFLGLLVGLTRRLSDPWDEIPILKRLQKN